MRVLKVEANPPFSMVLDAYTKKGAFWPDDMNTKGVIEVDTIHKRRGIRALMKS